MFSLLQSLSALFADFSSTSSIHGLRYLGERKLPCVQRLWWIITILLSLIGCSVLIKSQWRKWDETPVIVSIAERLTPIWKIPFPAVTLCIESKYGESATEPYLDGLPQRPRYTSNDMLALEHLCEEFVPLFYPSTAWTNNDTIADTIKNMSPRNSARFKLFNENLNVPMSITEEGHCYSFNSLTNEDIFRMANLHPNYQYITPRTGSPTLQNVNHTLKVYPLHLLRHGAANSMKIIIKLLTSEISDSCKGFGQGFRFSLHHPGEIPNIRSDYIRLPLNHALDVALNPQVFNTSEGLYEYLPEKRNCYLKDERYLRFFKIYTQRNCELECLSNYTAKTCGCVKFSMPRDNVTKECDNHKINCYKSAEKEIYLENYRRSSGEAMEDQTLTICNCMPRCESISYNADVFQGELTNRFSPKNKGEVKIYFKSDALITYKRSELFGRNDFLANCGGILGLFMGVSILSIVEIFYYFIVRMVCRCSKGRVEPKEIYLREVTVLRG